MTSSAFMVSQIKGVKEVNSMQTVVHLWARLQENT